MNIKVKFGIYVYKGNKNFQKSRIEYIAKPILW